MYYEIITNGQTSTIREPFKDDALRIAKYKEINYSQTVSVIEVSETDENLIYQSPNN